MMPKGIERGRPLKDLTWLKVGGDAEYFAAPNSIEDLRQIWRWAINEKLAVTILSGGSNVLVQDGQLRGLTLSLHNLQGIENVEKGDRVRITCLAGTPKSEIAKIFLQNKLAPAAFLTGIPGDVGGGIVMNAGIGEARVPREFCEIVENFEVLRWDANAGDFLSKTFQASEISWSYRHTTGWQPGIIVRATISWANSPDATLMDSVRAQTKKRVTTQPLDLPNCGSVFRNPTGHKAAQLIEACGLKGYRVGGAQVSPKHANFIVNDRGASAKDIDAIIRHVRDTVAKTHGITLQTEVVYLGDWGFQ